MTITSSFQVAENSAGTLEVPDTVFRGAADLLLVHEPTEHFSLRLCSLCSLCPIFSHSLVKITKLTAKNF